MRFPLAHELSWPSAAEVLEDVNRTLDQVPTIGLAESRRLLRRTRAILIRAHLRAGLPVPPTLLAPVQ